MSLTLTFLIAAFTQRKHIKQVMTGLAQPTVQHQCRHQIFLGQHPSPNTWPSHPAESRGPSCPKTLISDQVYLYVDQYWYLHTGSASSLDMYRLTLTTGQCSITPRGWIGQHWRMIPFVRTRRSPPLRSPLGAAASKWIQPAEYLRRRNSCRGESGGYWDIWRYSQVRRKPWDRAKQTFAYFTHQLEWYQDRSTQEKVPCALQHVLVSPVRHIWRCSAGF